MPEIEFTADESTDIMDVARRDYRQGFFARPGQGLPQRAPDLSKAVGR